ncbi:glycosyltransferase [Methylobacterium sp. BTF04]|uniref:glycosyltransferase n=1 Tax=Methylobacterium sp. BTF04 TaxID=2708300 RepID=UPI001FEDAD18|nr:glycosyltransferase [Methylobacterium sp. BTF04]
MPRPSLGARLGAVLAALVQHPTEASAILRARLAGKRVRARQAAAALLGLDHHTLWQRPSADAAAPQGSSSTAVVSAPFSSGEISENAEIVILTAPGHALVAGAAKRVTEAFATRPDLQAIYGDALFLCESGSAMPLLRPVFDPDYLMAVDYVGPVVAVRRAGLAALGGVARLSVDAPAFDLLFRIAEHFGRSAIGHLPRILSTWRPGPAGEGASDRRAGRLAIVRRHLADTGQDSTRAESDAAGIITLIRPCPEPAPLVSLIVPTRDRLDLLRPCIESLIHRTDWPSREILICDNDSCEPETAAYFRELAASGTARIVACPGPFDFAAMNNAAARVARGRLLAFVNNDVEATEPDWLARMVREALRPDVGAVGAKLRDREGRIQHGGVVLGPGGLVTHAHRFFAGDAPGYLAGLSSTRAVSAVTAACLVVEADKFWSVGGFDAAAFAVDFNDVDLCLRLNAAGYRTLFVGGAMLNHYEAASRRWNPDSRARHRREVEAFKTRWGPLLAQDPHYHPGFDPDLGTYARVRPGWPKAGPVAPR